MGITNRFCFSPTYTARCPFGTSTDFEAAWLAANDDVLPLFHPRRHQPHLLLFFSAVNLPHSSYCSSTKSSISNNETRRSQRLHKLQVQEPSSSPPSQWRCSPPPIRRPARILTPRVRRISPPLLLHTSTSSSSSSCRRRRCFFFSVHPCLAVVVVVTGDILFFVRCRFTDFVFYIFLPSMPPHCFFFFVHCCLAAVVVVTGEIFFFFPAHSDAG
ncbi:hypothetical protein PIB30_018885 [Stylosanthes scabra]|uniref:Uncharacterized protein n=1 Tax=Stylosanthes scabra TaxID=79078 RepID=A0ABU6W905_9FABA|nr:hypothetical protein [Stylosanthes scabra]